MSNLSQQPTTGKEAGKEINPDAVVINQIVIRPVNRTSSDISTWRSAHMAAESAYFPNRTRLYDLYEDIRLDGHLTGIMGKRFDTILNKGLRFEKAGKKVDEMDAVIESEVFRNIIVKLLEVKAYGLTGFEFIPGKLLHFEEIPRKHIKPERKIIAYEQTGLEGISYDGLDNVWIVESKKDLGFLLKCAPYAIWKRGDMADWAQYVELFGQPVRIMKYDAHDLKTKMELQTVVDEAGSSLALLIPKQADFEMQDGKASNGNGELQEKLMNACNNEMSVIVLGNTETTSNSNGGSLAKAKEHGKQQDEVTKSDIAYVRNLLNTPEFIKILKSYGLPVDGGLFHFEKEIDIYEAQARLSMVTMVAKFEPVAPETWYEIADIPKPDNYDELREKMDAANQPVETIEPDEERETPPAKPKKSGNKGGQKKKLAAQAKLSFMEKLRAEVLNFFDPAHKD